MKVEYFNLVSNPSATDDFISYSMSRTRDLPVLDLRFNNLVDEETKNIIEDICKNFKYFLIIGMGGASLNPKMYKAFRDNPNVFVIDNLESFVVDSILFNIKMEETAIISISKSGFTYETNCLTDYIISKFKEADITVKGRLFAITNQDTKLFNKIVENGGKCLQHKMNINGRFSTFTNIGLLMSNLVGFDYHAILEYARDYYNDLFAIKNRGFLANALSFHSYKDTQVLFSYGNVVNVAAKWIAQIMAESSGKNGVGLTPVCSEGPMDQHSQLQLYLEGPKNKSFHLMISSPYPSYQHLAKNMFNEFHILESLFVDDSYPVKKTYIDILNERSFAEFVMLNLIECILYCWFIGSNPFSQTSVDKIKRISKELI